MPPGSAPIIHWFRRDLRIADNLALARAAAPGAPVLPVYIHSRWRCHHAWTGPKRQQFLCGCLASLARDLESLGGRLIVRQGDALAELERLITETGARAIHFNLDPDPFGKQVERGLRETCARLGVECHGHADATLHPPDAVLTGEGKPYRVYTPYSRNWLSLDKPEPVRKPKSIHTPPGPGSLPPPSLETWKLAPDGSQLAQPGEKAARSRLKRALTGRIECYAAMRDIPAAGGTSRLSQDLRFGLLSIRTVFAGAMKARASAGPAAQKGIDTFIKELAWREFYFAILHHFPNVLDEEFNPVWRGLPWHEPGPSFETWQQGRTGFPMVDAGMRELLATGFMHNRARMVTAMFFTKDLHLDWKLGESHFMQHLIDGEIASNNGGWQWSAGTGADAAPYFRIQNPWSQSARFDPDGTYIKRWIPELAKVPSTRLHVPPAGGSGLAPDYPPPILDHKTERGRTLEMFKRHREQNRYG